MIGLNRRPLLTATQLLSTAAFGRCRCWLQLAAARLLSAFRSLWPLPAAPDRCPTCRLTLALSLQVENALKASRFVSVPLVHADSKMSYCIALSTLHRNELDWT